MKVSRDDVENRQTILHIEVEEDRVERHLQRAHTKVSQRINIPGFRKGKAPRRIVEQFVGRDYLLDEAMESLVPEAVGTAVEESDIETTHTPPRVNVTERDPVVKIDATVALTPVVTLGSYKHLKFEDQLDEVSEEQIEEQITQVRESQATWELVKRSVKMGDLLTITASGFSEGKEFAKVDSGEFLVEAGSMNPVPGFAEKLKGLKQGESKEFTLDIPQDYPNGEFAGKKVHFNVSVSDVKKKTLPNMTNAFVASLGDGIKTVAELRGRITDNLEKQATDGLRRSLEEKVIDALVEDAEFEVSPMIIEHEAEHVLEDQQRQLAQYNIDFQQYIDGLGKSNEEIVSEAKDSAELRLKRMLVVDRLVEDGGVTITPEQVAAETEIMQSQPQYEQENLDSDEARDAIQKVLQRRAAIDQVIATTHKPKTAKSKTKADGKKKNDK